jgi:hypothetical protein
MRFRVHFIGGGYTEVVFSNWIEFGGWAHLSAKSIERVHVV